MPERLTVIIPSAGQPERVVRLLESLRPQLAAADPPVELLLLDNRKTLEPEATLERLVAELPPPARYIKYPLGGKAAALNHVLPQVTGDIVLIIDDDMVAGLGWVAAAQRFFEESDYDFMQGRTLPHPADDLSKYAYPQLPLRDLGQERCPYNGLAGMNFGGRVGWFRRFPYHPGLGVGASGAGEDNLFGHQVRAAGARVGYEPAAVCYHPILPERCTRWAFRRTCYASGKSSLYWRRLRPMRIVTRLAWETLLYWGLGRMPGGRARQQVHEAGLFRNLGRLVGWLEARWLHQPPPEEVDACRPGSYGRKSHE